VQTSHLGQENASSVILNEDYYRGPDFPRASFHRQEGKTKALDRNLYHTKFFMAGEGDNQVLYFGSHNLSAGAWGNQEKNGS